ncbi:MAG: hypothetical protein ACTSRU_18490 [Candidatus Hodarchaeales archaeon]
MSQIQKSEHVIFRCQNGQIHELYWKPGGGWNQGNLSQRLGATQAVGRPAGYAWNANNSEHIVYRGVDNLIHELYWKPGGWNHSPLGQRTNAPQAASDPIGYVWQNNNSEHIAYRDTNDHIIELYLKLSGGGWNFSDLTAKTGAPPAASRPTGYSFENNGTEHIAYRGHDGAIYELYFKQGSWNISNLSQATGAPEAIGNPIGYAWENNRSEHIIFRSVDNLIYELYWKPGGGWNCSPLSQKLQAPPADSDPAAYVWESNSSEHIAYRGMDNHIHELYLKIGSGWNHSDLTIATGAAPASLDPAGYAFESNQTEHILYRGSNGHIYELYFKQGKWNVGDLTANTGASLADSSPIGYAFH